MNNNPKHRFVPNRTRRCFCNIAVLICVIARSEATW